MPASNPVTRSFMDDRLKDVEAGTLHPLTFIDMLCRTAQETDLLAMDDVKRFMAAAVQQLEAQDPEKV